MTLSDLVHGFTYRFWLLNSFTFVPFGAYIGIILFSRDKKASLFITFFITLFRAYHTQSLSLSSAYFAPMTLYSCAQDDYQWFLHFIRHSSGLLLIFRSIHSVYSVDYTALALRLYRSWSWHSSIDRIIDIIRQQNVVAEYSPYLHTFSQFLHDEQDVTSGVVVSEAGSVHSVTAVDTLVDIVDRTSSIFDSISSGDHGSNAPTLDPKSLSSVATH